MAVSFCCKISLILAINCLYEFEKLPSNITFKVMTWNILHGGNDLENGKLSVIEIIREINPDVILMVETYGSGKLIADSLGYNFHLIAPESTPLDDEKTNLSILTKYSFGNRIDTPYPFYLGGIEIWINNQKIRFLCNWFHYLPWEDEPEKLGKTTQELLEWEKSGLKYEMIQKVLPHIIQFTEEADSIPLVIGGDFNTLSHLDWGDQTKSLHNNLIVPWYATKVLEDIGLIDSYRTIHPNPLTHPGITWHTKGMNDAHRIDYIFYKSPKLRPIYAETYMSYFNENFLLHEKKFTYPSDHGILVTTFELKQ